METTQQNVSTGWDQPEQFRLVEEPAHAGAPVIVAAYGELDIATVPPLRERLTAGIAAGETRLLIDLTGVTFMDSVAMAAIIHARTQLPDHGRMAIVLDPDSYTRLVFEIAGLPQCLDLFETRAAALAALTA